MAVVSGVPNFRIFTVAIRRLVIAGSYKKAGHSR